MFTTHNLKTCLLLISYGCHEAEHSYTGITESLTAILRMLVWDITPWQSDSMSDLMNQLAQILLMNSHLVLQSFL